MRSFFLQSSQWSASKSALKTALARKLDRMQQALPEALRKTGATAAERLGELTFPGPSAIGIAMAAMRFDFGRIYATPGKVFEILEGTAGKQAAGAFYAAWKRGDLDRARDIIRRSASPISSIIVGRALDPSLREKFRDRNGRVMSAYPQQLVSQEEYAAGLKVAIAEIGKTASGWFACAEQLGGDGNRIRWKGTAVHGSDGGSVEIEWTEFGVRLIMTNHRQLARKHLSPGQVQRIHQEAMENLRDEMQSTIGSQAA